MLTEQALTLLRAHSPYGEALENHCLRLAVFATALGETYGVPVEADLLGAGAYLHDIGLCVRDPEEKSYLRRGVSFVRAQTQDWDLTHDQRHILDEMLLHNHSIKTVPGISPLAELVRKAVQIEHSHGHISHGLSKEQIKSVFDAHPRLDFNAVLFGFFKTVVKEDGPAELVRLFLTQTLPE